MVAADEQGRDCGSLSSYLHNDGPPISGYSYDVHHIDETLLVAENAPTQRDGMARFVDFLEQQAQHGRVVLVAHNGFAFDFKFLHHTLRRLDMELPAGVAHFVDTLQLARSAEWRPQPSNMRLSTLYHRATGQAISNAHDALADTRALMQVLFRLPELWSARKSIVHEWGKFQEVEDTRTRALAKACDTGARDAMENSDDELETDSDEESKDGSGDGDHAPSSNGSGVAAAGEWRRLRRGETIDRDPSELFRKSGARRGVKLRRHWGAASTAMDVFVRLFQPVEALLVEETNRYAAQKMAAKLIKHFLSWCATCRRRPFADLPFVPLLLRRWKPVSTREMRAFWLALLVTARDMTSCMSLRWADVSDISLVSVKAFVTKHIGRYRWEQIRRFLHASNSAKQPRRGEEGYDAAYKVRRLLQKAVHSWNKHYDPGSTISVDETLLSFKGRWEHNVAMRSKRHKAGIKLFVATSVRPNYVVAVDVKCAKHDDSTQFEATKVVGKLMEMAHLLDQHRTVVTDNYYTSVELMHFLKERDTYSYGVLRQTRVPACVKFSRDDERQGRGFSKTWYSPHHDGIAVGWLDNKVLYCLSNATSSSCTHRVERRVKGVGRVHVTAPDTLRRYNLDMGGVDCVDAIISRASIAVAAGRTRKWWMKVLWYIVDVMVTNANVIFNELHGSNVTRRDFVLQLSLGLSKYVQETPSPPPPGTTPGSAPVAAHLPQHCPKRARCKVCKRLTQYTCSSAACPPNTRLCHPQLTHDKRQCFATFHAKRKRFPASIASPAVRSVRRRQR